LAAIVGDMLSAVDALLSPLMTCCRLLNRCYRHRWHAVGCWTAVIAVGDMLSAVEPLLSPSVTCCRLLNRLVPPSWAGHFLSERQKVTKKRVAWAAGYQFLGIGGSGGGDFRLIGWVVPPCYAPCLCLLPRTVERTRSRGLAAC